MSAYKNGEEGTAWPALVQVVPCSFEDRPVRNLLSLSHMGIFIPSLPCPGEAACGKDGRTDAAVRISVPGGGTEVLADDGKHDLAPVLS